MKLLANGKEVPVLQLVAQESLGQYYTSYVVVVPVRLKVKSFVIKDKTSSTYYIMREELHNTTYTYTVVVESVYKLLNTTFPSVTGMYTVKQVLAKLGFKTNFAFNTTVCFWHIPSFKFASLIDYLSRYTLFPNGGATYFNLNDNGVLECVDLKIALESNSSRVLKPLSVKSVNAYVDWIQKVPGEVSLTVGSSKGVKTSTLIIESNSGKGSVFINDTTGYEEDMMRRVLTTAYYTNKYTSRKIEVTLGGSAFNVGETAELPDLGKFVVFTRVVNVALSDDTPSQVSYTLVSAI